MKSVALKVLNGPDSGQHIWVRLEQIMLVGTSHQSDVVILTDSEFQFSIGHARAGCFVECLSATKDMTINGKTFSRARLHDGDILDVGDIQFQAILE